jgi:hypothetical protein
MGMWGRPDMSELPLYLYLAWLGREVRLAIVPVTVTKLQVGDGC